MSNNIETVQKIYAAFGRGDVPGVLEHISDDLVGFGVVADTFSSLGCKDTGAPVLPAEAKWMKMF